MATLLAVLIFAVVYAAATAVVDRISVYWLGFWDPKFGDQAGNVAVADEGLPVFVALATLMFLVGLGSQRAALGRMTPAVVALGAAVCGVSAGLLLLADPGLRQLGINQAVTGTIGIMAFWAGPAAMAVVVFRSLGNRRPLDRSER